METSEKFQVVNREWRLVLFHCNSGLNFLFTRSFSNSVEKLWLVDLLSCFGVVVES